MFSVSVFNKVLSMIVIGVGYIPLFSALALESAAGYLVGTGYAWMLLTINVFHLTECELVIVSIQWPLKHTCRQYIRRMQLH